MLQPLASVFILAMALLADATVAADAPPPPMASVVRDEALRLQQDPAGRPLPLVAHWHRASLPLAAQLRLIEQGYPVLPWIDFDRTTSPSMQDRKSLATLRDWRMPFALLTGGQWEADFYLSPDFKGRPLAETGLADDRDGKPVPKLSPFSPVEPWREVGRLWSRNRSLELLQTLYPAPPRVFFISNNEARKLAWADAETSRTYLDTHGVGRSGAYRREVSGDGWILRYRAMLEAMRAGLTADAWRRESRFIAYNGLGPDHWGRWGGWREHSLVTEERISPNWYFWNGAIEDAYDNPWESPKAVFNLWSMQSELMNLVFMREEALRVQPDFWFELIFWDGNAPGAPNDTYTTYARQGVAYTPELYEGWVQYGMWLLVPRVAREWRGHNDPQDRWWPHFEAVLRSVQRVHQDDVLRRFWREGQLVPNLAHPHPFGEFLPAKWSDAGRYPRWFHLDTDLDPPFPAGGFKPGHHGTPWPVWTLARVIGKAPRREWLVYAHAPAGSKTKVSVTIPGYRRVVLPEVAISGSFYRVHERTGAVEPVAQTPSSIAPESRAPAT